MEQYSKSGMRARYCLNSASWENDSGDDIYEWAAEWMNKIIV